MNLAALVERFLSVAPPPNCPPALFLGKRLDSKQRCRVMLPPLSEGGRDRVTRQILFICFFNFGAMWTEDMIIQALWPFLSHVVWFLCKLHRATILAGYAIISITACLFILWTDTPCCCCCKPRLRGWKTRTCMSWCNCVLWQWVTLKKLCLFEFL